MTDLDDQRWFTAVIRTMDREYLELRKPQDGKGKVREVRFDDHVGIRSILRAAAAARPVETIEHDPEE